MNAIRTVSETDDVHVIEGLGIPFRGPFRGKDSYGTTFSVRSNLYWDLFPDSMDDPQFIRPTTFDHGFNPEIGLSRVGGWSPVRTDDKGTWVRSQLDKHHEYYGAIRELLDKDALGFSAGSAEHSVRVDRVSGEILDWPIYELALTTTPSNPYAVIAARSADVAETIRIVEARAAGAETPTRAIQTFDDIVASAVLDDELPEAFSTLTSAIYSAIWAMDAEYNPVPLEEKRSAIQTSLDQFRDYVLGLIDRDGARSADTLRSAIRAVQATVEAGKKALAAEIGQVAQNPGTNPDNDETLPAPTPDDAARSGDPVPLVTITEEPEDPAAVRAALLVKAAEVGTQVAQEVIKR